MTIDIVKSPVEMDRPFALAVKVSRIPSARTGVATADTEATQNTTTVPPVDIAYLAPQQSPPVAGETYVGLAATRGPNAVACKGASQQLLWSTVDCREYDKRRYNFYRMIPALEPRYFVNTAGEWRSYLSFGPHRSLHANLSRTTGDSSSPVVVSNADEVEQAP